MKESCHIYGWAYHTHEWVMSHIWMSHVTHINIRRINTDHQNSTVDESRYTYESCYILVTLMWVRDSFICSPLLWKSWLTPLFWRQMNESRHTYESCYLLVTLMWVRDSFICSPLLWWVTPHKWIPSSEWVTPHSEWWTVFICEFVSSWLNDGRYSYVSSWSHATHEYCPVNESCHTVNDGRYS